MKITDVSIMSEVFSALCDETRLRLLLSLQRGERNVTGLCEQLRLPQPTVSHHLGLLRRSGLVRNRRKGKQVLYALHEEQFVKLRKMMTSLLLFS